VTPVEIAAIVAAVTLGGTVKGLSGFGYSIVGTTLLLLVFPPPEAVSLMIVPLMAANLKLVTEFSFKEFAGCIRSFSPYLVSGLIGTVIGVYLLEHVTATAMKLLLGSMALLFAASRTRRFQPYIAGISSPCFRKEGKFQTLLGALTGILFGSTNIAVQAVAYLESLEMDRHTFVGLLATVMLGLSSVRLLLSLELGYFVGTEMLGVSMVAAIPGVGATYIGERIRHQISREKVAKASLLMIAAIGLKLIYDAAMLITGSGV